MKNFGIIFLIFGLLFTSCGEETISQREKREAKELTKQETEQENETIFKTPEAGGGGVWRLQTYGAE